MGLTAQSVLDDDGYRFIVPVHTAPGDYDNQGHLNNASIVRLFNDLRVKYVHTTAGEWWFDELRVPGTIVAARELHVLYESEALPGESLVGAMKYSRRQGKAAIVEQRLVEQDTGRGIARAWIVQLLARDGRAVDWPERYFDEVAAVEGRPIPQLPRAAPPTFGPPPFDAPPPGVSG